jgi:sec-independent protein translocase protein TatB
MEFFGVGPLELVVILVVALIFVGPERLPRLAADIARTIRDIRRYTGSIAAEFSQVLEEIEKETEDDRTQWKEIGEGLTGAAKSVSDAVRAARDEAEGARVVQSPKAPPAPPEATEPARPDATAEPRAAESVAPAATTASPADAAPPPAAPADHPANGATPAAERAGERR